MGRGRHGPRSMGRDRRAPCQLDLTVPWQKEHIEVNCQRMYDY